MYYFIAIQLPNRSFHLLQMFQTLTVQNIYHWLHLHVHCTCIMVPTSCLEWDVKVKCICHPVCHFSDNLQVSFIKELVFYLFVAVLEFSSGIAGGYRCLCPSFWPQCHQKMQKPTTTNGLPSTTVFSITKVDNKT